MPALCRERRKPFRLYLSNVTFLGVASWANLAAAAGKALTGGGLLGGDALRIVVEGPALAAPGVFKDHVRGCGRGSWLRKVCAGTAPRPPRSTLGRPSSGRLCGQR